MTVRRVESGNPLLYLFQKTWQYSEGNRKQVVSLYAMFIVATSLTLFLNPLITAKMINIVVEVIKRQELSPADLKKICLLAALPFVVRFLFWCLHGPARIMENINAYKARVNYRSFLLRGVLTLPLEWHTEHHSGDSIDKVEKGTSALYNFSGGSFQVVYALIKFAGSFGMLAYFSPRSVPIILFFVVATMAVTMMFDKVMIPQYRDLNRAENQVAEGVFDAISNISTVIILRVEKLVYEGLLKKIWYRYDLYKRNNILNELKWFATSMCASLMTSCVFISYFWHYRHHLLGISAGSVFILWRYLEEMSETFFEFTSMYGDLVIRATRMQNAEELAADFIPESFTDHVLPKDWQHLEARGLSFSYHSEEGDLHLEDVSLSFRRGERIALVGRSGYGKSTLLKIVRDLHHPRDLRLRVDGNVVQEGFGAIARAIALVPQSPEIFKSSIRDNITLGAVYEDSVIRRYTDMACFTEVVTRLPQGLDSSVKEKGVNLSGGEQQRLALARGLLASADKDIVLLDEPTASIDAENEMEIYKRIFEGFSGKTIISTIHRLHLLPYFDRIYVFERGKIVAEGSLAELLEASPVFQELWEKYTIEKCDNELIEL